MKRFGISLPEIILLTIILIYIFAAHLFPLKKAIDATPKGTQYFYAAGYLIDYYQYLSWIKQGGQGKIPLETRYRVQEHQPVLIHPFFTIWGYLTHQLSIPPHVSLYIARLLGETLFILSFFYLIKRLSSSASTPSNSPSASLASISLILLIITTDIYDITKDSSGTSVLIEPLLGITNFNVVSKLMLSPHHALALACVLTAFAIMLHPLKSLRSLTPLIILGTAACFLNPSVITILLMVFAVSIPIMILLNIKNLGIKHSLKIENFKFQITLLAFAIPAFLVLLYHQMVFASVSPYSYWFLLAKLYDPVVYFSQYLKALGPIFPLSLLFLLKKEYRSRPIIIILATWAYLPIALFLLRNKYVPMNAQRIFQSYQYIPMVILAATGISYLFEKARSTKSEIRNNFQNTNDKNSKRYRFGHLNLKVSNLFRISIFGFRIFPLSMLIALCLYALPPAYLTLKSSMTDLKTSFYNVYIPDSGVKALQYLDVNTPDESVVVAGEYVSNYIPAFTHNRVLIGRDDAIENYHALRDQVFAFIDGRMKEEEMKQFIKENKIKYLLLGIDATPWVNSKLNAYPYFKEIFRDGQVSIVQVTL